MATVTGYTAAKMEEIADAVIVDAEVTGDNLILERFDGATIDAGNVRGPQGVPGTNGTNGTNGAQGPDGPTAMVGQPINLNTSHALMSASGLISGMARNNVPVISGNLYGVKIDLTASWASVDADARWDIWCRLNGVDLERFAVINPGTVGVSHPPIRGEIFWTAPATQSTDDFTVFAQLVTAGATLTPSGSASLKRKLWVVDYGTP